MVFFSAKLGHSEFGAPKNWQRACDIPHTHTQGLIHSKSIKSIVLFFIEDVGVGIDQVLLCYRAGYKTLASSRCFINSAFYGMHWFYGMW